MRFFHNLIWSTRGSDYENSAIFFSREFFQSTKFWIIQMSWSCVNFSVIFLDPGFVSESFSDEANINHQHQKTLKVNMSTCILRYTKETHTQIKKKSQPQQQLNHPTILRHSLSCLPILFVPYIFFLIPPSHHFAITMSRLFDFVRFHVTSP